MSDLFSTIQPLKKNQLLKSFLYYTNSYLCHCFSGAITTDLRQYLNTRFPKGGVDHELQNTIRDNLYLRTVPVTTRTPRPEERHGVDYTFLSKEEFIALEKSGELLESGVFDGKLIMCLYTTYLD